MTKEEKKRAAEMRKSGAGYKTIAAELDVPVTTIASFCKTLARKSEGVCLHCGAKITDSRTKPRKFCSDKCRMLWWHSHPEEINRQAFYEAVCLHCGRTFWSYGNDHRKFCSRKCYADHRRKDRPF